MRIWRAWPLVLLAFPASVALAADHDVGTGAVSYSPNDLSVAVGDTVTWRNTSGGFHNVHFDDGTVNAPPSNADWSYPRTFTEAGEYRYHCDFHGPGMSGVVRVGTSAPTPTPTPTATPTAPPDPDPDPSATPGPSATPTPDPGGSAPPPVAATIDDLRVRRRAKGGRVRLRAAVGPAGTELTIVVRRAGKRVGRRTVTVQEAGVVAFTVRLNRATRRALRRAGKLRVQVVLTAGDARTATSVRVKP
jgi:plastocyanin